MRFFLISENVSRANSTTSLLLIYLNNKEHKKCIFLAIRVCLRGKAHCEWKVLVSGDRRTVKDDQYLMDERAVVWGKGNITLILFNIV